LKFKNQFNEKIMQKIQLNVLDELLEEVKVYSFGKPDWLFSILTWDFTEYDKKNMKIMSNLIKEEVQNNPEFKKTEVRKYYNTLPNYHLLGIEK